MTMRNSTCFLCTTAMLAIMSGLMLGHARWKGSFEVERIDSADLVRELELTDLCLFTEASYTRHITQTDLRTPFQTIPMALEHFPSGSLMIPPQHLKGLSALRHD